MREINPPIQSVSERTQERLAHVRESQDDYEPNELILRDIGQKSLALFIGPSLTGKSTLIDEIARLDARFGKVKSFSTREPRPDDTPDTMVCIPWQERDIRRVCNIIEAGDAVQYVFHKKTDDIYGTVLDSYPKQYNLLPALSNSVAPMERLPFRSLRSIGVVITPDELTKRIERRQFASPNDLAKRLAEGATSLAWMLEHPGVAIFNNPDGQLARTALGVRDYITSDSPSNVPRDEDTALQLLRHIRDITR